MIMVRDRSSLDLTPCDNGEYHAFECADFDCPSYGHVHELKEPAMPTEKPRERGPVFKVRNDDSRAATGANGNMPNDEGAEARRITGEAERSSDRLAKVSRFLGNDPVHREFMADYLKERDVLDGLIRALLAIIERVVRDRDATEVLMRKKHAIALSFQEQRDAAIRKKAHAIELHERELADARGERDRAVEESGKAMFSQAEAERRRDAAERERDDARAHARNHHLEACVSCAEAENARLRERLTVQERAIRHATSRNHRHTTACDGCKEIDAALKEPK